MAYNPPSGPPPQQGYPAPPPSTYQPYGAHNEGAGGYAQPQQSQSNPFADHKQQQQQQYAGGGDGHGGEYAMNGSQPYAQQVPAPPQQQEPYVDYSQKPSEGERFRPKKRLNDPIFLVLFLATLAGWAALSGIAIHGYSSTDGLGGGVGRGRTGSDVTLNSSTAYLLCFVGAAALALATLFLMLIRVATKIIMEVTLVLNVLVNIGLCAYMWSQRYYSGAIILTIIAVISILAYFGMRRRIPLARLLLQVVMDISKHHKSVYIVCLLALVVQTALSIWFSFTVAAIYVKWTPDSAGCDVNGGSCSSGKVAGLVFFAFFAFFWTSQVVANVALATLAGGAYGGWYYYGPNYDGKMPKHPNWHSFVRASTLSLGSIAFGSLIVTILELLRVLFNIIRQNASQDGNVVGAILACVASCCIGCIESMVNWFNRYAYIEIALYGKAYIPAAKDAWRLMKDRGIDALINDSIIGILFTFMAYFVGLCTALFGYVYLRATDPAYNADGDYTPIIVLMSFSIGLQAGLALAQALEGGVSTIFVCLGEDPAVLAERSPALFEEVRRNYPRVVQGVPYHGV